jgi:hypothetical protein
MGSQKGAPLPPSEVVGCADCGAKDMEVHRRLCPTWEAHPDVQGSLPCQACGKTFNNTANGRCGVCDYWHRAEHVWR